MSRKEADAVGVVAEDFVAGKDQRIDRAGQFGARRARSAGGRPSLNGTVTLAPRPPAAMKLAQAFPQNASVQARGSPVVEILPGLRAKAAWMSGDLLCAMGLPKTA